MPVLDLPVSILNDPELLDVSRRMSTSIQSTHAEHPWFGPVAEEIDARIQELNSVRNPADLQRSDRTHSTGGR